MSMNPFIARFADEPALVDQASVGRFRACLEALGGHKDTEKMLAEQANTTDDFWSEDNWRAIYRPYVVVDGILQIPVKGVLLHNYSFALGNWATGYDYIWRAFQRGCADFAIGAIKGIAFVQDTPGGMVAGCFDAIDKMLALKETCGVPVRAFAHESAYSAGYAIAMVADHIVVSRTGGVGSIGVVTSHIDVSGAMDKAGVKITFIASDPSKTEGNPYEALSPEAKARIKARIDELYAIFVSTVARSRDLSEETIREDLKAFTYTATQALSNGLADSVGSLDDALAAYAADLSSTSGDEEMSTMDTSAETQAAINTARTDGHTAGHAEGMKAGVQAERTRIAAILGSDEAKKRPAAAHMLAFETDKDAESAVASLAKLPEEVAEKPQAETTAGVGKEVFEAAMTGTGNPNVGTGEGETAEVSPDDAKGVLSLAHDLAIPGLRKRA